MHAAQGILTARGGMTSHAAVVARGMGRPCVSGAGALAIDYKNRLMRVGGREIKEGELITLDGSTGEVMLGEVPTVQPELVGDFGTLMDWADAVRRLRVRTNAETVHDCRTAREFGAEGIGLCRTEHMFFDPERIANVRQMILAEDEAGRRAALDKLLPAQRGDFVEIFRIMAGLPVTIRLLDPPLHEFLPHAEEEFAEVARASGLDVETLRRRAGELPNPIRCSAIAAAGSASPIPRFTRCRRAPSSRRRSRSRGEGEAPLPEVMVPLVATRAELAIIRELIERTAERVFDEQGRRIDYLVGTMIELPRAALAAALDRRGSELLQLRHQRPYPDRARRQPRRCRPFPRHLCREGHLRPRSVRHPRRRGRRRADHDRGGAGQGSQARPQARHLRRAWRRSGLDRLLRGGRARLRQRLALSRADRPARRGAGGPAEDGALTCAAGRAT